ncbi:carbohydrate ABC transporter permease [Schleiferilactobacillus perolens]|jgi:N-acetylglucosamine transport system permease protein|uniref:ABC transmembrane type-1 domain-containing protein n=1 Tax=Schleiferilactobacillus perolens DSM 12744 TaxID=1423792 RepID=A0A0R1N3B9_9LACO|nr:carbohydrate ABC transporter permease [Schleiferilactobacillus perolens]KRL14686.1 hypothetical protein FD09_GL000342 [Schleiferilactobacillus perolens DSM 12744]MCI1893096.1 carbohydrate ABC transporter permease [Schleiferilactobacillus harbinensis]MCI1912556.1 carbohydrate ABC transporter permease [Schleiferilactobacillus harbinensis]MCI2169979.1 carbohydrate ABC transporter permease [Schleiferilactobacillus perolens]
MTDTKSKGTKLYKLFVYFVLIALAIVIVVPIAWVFLASVKGNAEFYGNPWSWPKSFHWENFTSAWTTAGMGRYLGNSVFVTALSLVLLIIIALPASYVLARFRFFGQKFWNGFFMLGLFINANYIVVPIFLMLLDGDTKLQQLIGHPFFMNNLWVLSLVYASTALPFTIYLLSNYFRTLPASFEEAAYIDGAGYFTTFMKVMAPMARPSIITVILFNFLSFWNEYIMALTLIPGDNKTLPVGLLNLSAAQKSAQNYGQLYAGLVIVMLPTLILYIMVQKQLTKGMTVGGVKG